MQAQPHVTLGKRAFVYKSQFELHEQTFKKYHSIMLFNHGCLGADLSHGYLVSMILPNYITR